MCAHTCEFLGADGGVGKKKLGVDEDNDGSDAPVYKEYGGKVVYGFGKGLSEKVQLLRMDCEKRGGEFGVCGDICAPDASGCAEVCAYTCEALDL
jgi:hypothetical protein